MKRFLKSKLIFALVVVAMFFGIVATLSKNVPARAADSDTYSWPSAPCAWNGNTTGLCYKSITDYSTYYDWGLKACPSGDKYCNSKNQINGYYQLDNWGYAFRNCTSYVAEKISQEFNFRSISGWGNASNWAYAATHNGNTFTLDSTPQVGDIAVWGTEVAHGYGHVAYVASVNNGVATFDEYNAKNDGTFTNNNTSANYPGPKGQTKPPDWYIHMGTPSGSGGSPTTTPVAVSRDSSDMAVFYNDGNSNLVNWSWNSTTGWAKQQWSDSGGILGQPAVVSRTTDSMDVFYTTGQHKLIHKGWTGSAGWAYFDVLLSSDVAGDPAVTARDSGDMQIFYRTLEGDIKSIYWSSVTGWNTNPQQLYVGAATTDPYAVSRGSGSMEVFFGKNNGNIVHLGWTSAYGWVTQDWSTNSTKSLPSKPTAVSYNSGGDMATYFQENNGYVGGESWDWQTGWSGQNWGAQLVGNPSAIAGVSNTVDNFYRETGGNIVDRYLSGGSWATTNIVGAGSTTGNPYAITRGTTNEEVFYWNGTSLMDANWNTTSHSWSASKIN